MISHPTYSTTDFYLACYLKAKGEKFTGCSKIQGGLFSFNFDGKCEIRSDFYTDKFVTDFVHAIKDLKSLIYNV